MCRPFSLDDPPTDDSHELDDLRADISQLEDRLLGLEHDLELIAEVHRALDLTAWGQTAYVGVERARVTEDQAAVLDRLSML